MVAVYLEPTGGVLALVVVCFCGGTCVCPGHVALNVEWRVCCPSPVGAVHRAIVLILGLVICY